LENDIIEIATKNYLKKKNIPYKNKPKIKKIDNSKIEEAENEKNESNEAEIKAEISINDNSILSEKKIV